MAILPYGESVPKPGDSLYRYTDTDAFIFIDNTEYQAPEENSIVLRMESEILHTICVAILKDRYFCVRWWPENSKDIPWVIDNGLRMENVVSARRVFPSLYPYDFVLEHAR